MVLVLDDELKMDFLNDDLVFGLSQTYFANSNSNCGVIFFPDFRIV